MKQTASFTPIGVTFETIDNLAKRQETDAIALYMAYCSVGHWQKTFQPRATNTFMKKRLGWGDKKLTKARKVLKSLGLIEDIKENKTGKFEKSYIKVLHLVDSEHSQKVTEFKNNSVRNKRQVLSTKNKVLSTKNKCLQSKDCPHEIHYKDVIDTHDRPNIPKGKTPKQSLFMKANQLGWYYKQEVKRLHGVDPIFNKGSGGKQFTIAKNAIKQIGLEKAKQHCTAYLQDKDSSEFNIDFSTVFSTAMINKFLPKINKNNKVRF